MDITTKFRSHWVAADGTRHASRITHDGPNIRIRHDLQPIINLDEVRGWIDTAMSVFDQEDARMFYARQFVRVDAHSAERERLAPLICAELTDDIPRYAEQWRQPFINLRNRWPGVDGLPVIAAR